MISVTDAFLDTSIKFSKAVMSKSSYIFMQSLPLKKWMGYPNS